jgi:uncharacterized membrane protein YfcA
MSVTILLALFVVGCVTGFLAGYFGVGGGVILIPFLLYLFREVLSVSSLAVTHLTFGTSLFIVVLTSLSSAYSHYRNGNIVPRAVVIIGVTSILAAFGGAAIAALLEGRNLQHIFSAVLAFAAIGLLVKPQLGRKKDEPSLRPGGLVATGLVTGLVSALAGVGGGVVSIPLMYYGMHFPMKRAVGTSSGAIVLTAFAGAMGYVLNGLGNPDLAGYPFALGFVDYLHSLPIIAGTIPMARIGADAAHRTPHDRLRKFFAVFLLAISVDTAFF